MFGCLFSNFSPYISSGINISLNNNGKKISNKISQLRWGYEITGGAILGPLLHLKISYGKNYFNNLNKAINYYSLGGGLTVLGYERGAANLEGENLRGKRSNIYIGGFIYPIAIAWDITGMVGAGILPTNFYSREKFVFPDTTYINHKLWQKFSIIDF